MKATSRSSAPSSSAIATMPEAPPATEPSAAVARSRPVVRLSATPQAMLIPRVARLTRATGSHEPASDPSEDACT